MSDDDRVDLEWTGWRLDEARERALVERIVAASRLELGRRAAARPGFVLDLGRWLRPVLAAAAVLAAVSLATLVRVERDGQTPAATTGDALDLPSPVVQWIARDRAPAMEELIVAFAESEE